METKYFSVIVPFLLVFSGSGNHIKFYDDNINKTEVIDFLESINQSYFKGINLFKIYNINSTLMGYYYPPNSIQVNVFYDYENIVYHELAHSYLFQEEGYLSFQNKNHKSKFIDMYFKIKNEHK